MKASFLLLLLLSISSLQAVVPNPLDDWKWRNPLPQGDTTLALTYGNGLFIAVGGGGTVVTSPDGTNWTLRPTGTNIFLNVVAAGNGVFVIGRASRMFVSSDLMNWGALPTNLALIPVFADGLFVGVDGTTNIWSSSDGTNWNRRTPHPYTRFQTLQHAGGQFIAEWEEDYGAEIRYGLATSPDATNWTFSLRGTTNYYIHPRLGKIVFGNGRYVSVLAQSDLFGNSSVIRTGTSTTNWSAPVIFPNTLYMDVVFVDGRFVALDAYGRIVTSLDGITWVPTEVPEVYLAALLAYGNSTFAAVGFTPGIFAVSPDGTNWVRHAAELNSLTSILYTNGLYVAVGGRLGDGGLDSSQTVILTSSNALNWTRQNAVTSNSLSDVAWGHGLYATVGERGTVLASSNAIDWQLRPCPSTSTLYSVAFGNGRFVAVGATVPQAGVTWKYTIVTSEDGLTWTLNNASAYPGLEAVAFGGGRFVAVGASGLILTSADGLTWTGAFSGSSATLREVAYLNGKFWAAGTGGTLLVSTNGSNWTQDSSVPGGSALRSITFGNGIYVAVSWTGRIASRDAIGWRERHSPTANALFGVIFAAGSFVAVGDHGTVIQTDSIFSPDRITLDIRNEGGLKLNLSAPIERTYAIHEADSLTPLWTEFGDGWIPWQHLTNVSLSTNATVQLPLVVTNQMRFFRVSPYSF